MVKVSSTISQKSVAGSISQKEVSGSIAQKAISGSIVESGYVALPVGTAPVFVSAVVENAAPTLVVITYDQALLESSTPVTTDFTVTSSTINTVTVSGTTVTLTLAAAVAYGDVKYITYTGGTNKIKGLVGELEADDLTSTLITNNVESAYEAETIALLAAMDVQPSTALAALINTTILSLKTEGIWALSKRIYCRRVHDVQASTLDWKRGSDSTYYNSPIFRAGYGIKGNGSSMYVKNGFNANILTNNSNCHLLWMTTFPTANGSPWGAVTTTRYFDTFNVSLRRTTVAIGGTATGFVTIPAGDEHLISWDRTDASTMHNWLDGGSKSTKSVANAANMPLTEVGELCYLSSGNPTGYIDIEIGWSIYCDVLSDAQQASAYTIMKNFNDNVVAAL